MSRRSFRIAAGIVGATLAVLLVIGGFVAYSLYAYPDRRHDGDGAMVEVVIPPRASFGQVAKVLSSRGVIERPFYFRLFGMHTGVTNKIRAGTYQIPNDRTPREVVAILLAGVKAENVSVKLVEGKHMLEYFDALAEAGVADRAELERVARDKTFLTARGIAGDSVDGYLFPDTYRFKRGDKAEAVLERLIEQHRKVWDEVAREHARPLAKLKRDLGWNDHQVLILASIVEKEAVEQAERPRIAQVFINRLTSPTFSPKKLETDPTIRYGCMVVPLAQRSAPCKAWDPSQRLFTAQLRDTDNPYNTYAHEGLPPGPIANPGRLSMAATMNPDGSDYLYFVAKSPREHVFSKTYADHNRAVDKYMRGIDN